MTGNNTYGQFFPITVYNAPTGDNFKIFPTDLIQGPVGKKILLDELQVHKLQDNGTDK